MNLLKLFAALFVFFALTTAVAAQNTDLAKITQQAVKSITSFNDSFPQEKVYLQTDRSYYAAGETVWMKAWATLEGRPTYLSKILYVDLVNESGQVVQKKMYKLSAKSSTPCDMLLDANTASGTYLLRAYTLWMLNFREFLFTTPLYIVGNGKANTGTANSELNVQFFPEGGEMIAGLPAVVAYKAWDGTGRGQDVSGVVKDETGREVLRFRTQHDGMGSFVLEPAAGKSYTAEITSNQGPVVKKSLPAAKTEGVSLSVNNASPTRLFLSVAKKTTAPATYNNLLVVGQMHNTVVYQAQINFEEGATAASIPKKNLPPGILQLTIFDGQGNPLAERLAFIKNMTSSEVSLSVPIKNLSSKAKNEVQYQIAGAKNPDLSLLVKDAGDTLFAPPGIVSSLLLTSDIKGYVHNPDYYFRSNDGVTNKHLDLLLITQGWRRFVWKDIMAGVHPRLRYPVESAIAIKGLVTKPGTKTPVQQGRVDLIIKTVDSTTLMSEASITDKGEFIVDNLDIQKEAAVAYQGTNAKKEKLVVDVALYPSYIDSLRFVPLQNGLALGSPAPGSSEAKRIQQQIALLDSVNKRGMLENVTVRTTKLSGTDSLNKEYATGLFEFGGRRLDPQNKAFFSLWQFLRNVPGFVIEGDMKNPTVTLSRSAGVNVFGDNTQTQSTTFADAGGTTNEASVSGFVENGIAFFLNEVPISRDVLDNLSMADVAFVKTYLGAETSAVGPYNAAIAVYTKKGTAAGQSILSKAFAKSRIQGYAFTREFYSPDYTLRPDLVSTEDTRVTLAWKPNLALDQNGKGKVVFYNNDASKRLRLIVQGLDGEGRLIYKEQILE